MPRRVNHTERISDSFDALAPFDQTEMLARLFTRLDAGQADRAMLLMQFWRNMRARNNGQPQEDKTNA